MSEASHVRLEFSDNSLLQELVGPHNSNLHRLEQRLNVVLHHRGNTISVEGTPDRAALAERTLYRLYDHLAAGHELDMGEVDGAVRLSEPDSDDAGELAIRTRKRQVAARSIGQGAYLRALNDHELVFALGPAGTGKTYIAVAKAVSLKMSGAIDRIILSRPAVEAGERLGFLPGDLREKVDPYLRPLYDALYDMLPGDQVAKLLVSGEIEVAPLAFMRGRTLANAFIILDEAQNTTPVQMKMALTRIGENSRMVVTGDLSQIDLPKGVKSGLEDALETLNDVRGVGLVRFTARDVVRHDLVTRIVDAYDRRDAARKDRAGTGMKPAAPTVDVLIAAVAWTRALPTVAAHCRKAARAAYRAAAPRAAQRRAAATELSLVLTSDAAICKLNADYRRKDKPTNVLSFPAGDRDDLGSPGALILGDVVIAYGTVAREAREAHKSLKDHLSHMVVHGVLHLLGYDHESRSDARTMEGLETQILSQLGVPDPYAEPGPRPSLRGARRRT